MGVVLLGIVEHHALLEVRVGRDKLSCEVASAAQHKVGPQKRRGVLLGQTEELLSQGTRLRQLLTHRIYTPPTSSAAWPLSAINTGPSAVCNASSCRRCSGVSGSVLRSSRPLVRRALASTLAERSVAL